MVGIICKVFAKQGDQLFANPAYMSVVCVQYSLKYSAMIVTGAQGDILIKRMSPSFYSRCMERLQRDIREGRCGTEFNSEGAFWGFPNYDEAVRFIEQAPELYNKSTAAWDTIPAEGSAGSVRKMQL